MGCLKLTYSIETSPLKVVRGNFISEEKAGAGATPYLFNGKELDEETGLYYYGARYYDPVTSVFPSVDPMTRAFPMLTPYQFASNQPIWAIDLDGLERKISITDQHGFKIQLELGIDGVDKEQITQTVLSALGWDFETYTKFLKNKYGEDEMFLWESGLSLNINTYTDANGLSQASLMSSSVEFDASKVARAWKRFDQDMRELDKEYPWLNNEMWEGEKNFKERGWKLMVAGPVVMFGLGYAIEAGVFSMVFQTKGETILVNMTKDALGQLITKNGDFGDVDWANVIISGVIKIKVLEDATKSFVDISIDNGANIKELDKGSMEMIVRTVLRDAFKDTKSKEFMEELFNDVIKKLMQEAGEEVGNEAIDATKELLDSN